MKKLLVLPIAAVVALAAVTAYAAWDRGGGDAGTSSSAVPSEGIDVHGDWKIAIYNEDGSLDQEYVFSNALFPEGASLLGRTLVEPVTSGEAYEAIWGIVMGDTGTPNVSPCVYPIGDSRPLVQGGNSALVSGCLLIKDGEAQGIPEVGSLTKEAIDGGLRLSGTVTATQAGSVDYVETWVSTVDNDETVAMTGTDTGPFENIEVGQIIQVQVEITFDTPAP